MSWVQILGGNNWLEVYKIEKKTHKKTTSIWLWLELSQTIIWILVRWVWFHWVRICLVDTVPGKVFFTVLVHVKRTKLHITQSCRTSAAHALASSDFQWNCACLKPSSNFLERSNSVLLEIRLDLSFEPYTISALSRCTWYDYGKGVFALCLWGKAKGFRVCQSRCLYSQSRWPPTLRFALLKGVFILPCACSWENCRVS